MTTATLRTTIARALAQAQLPPDAHLLVAVSGGPDSMALIDALLRYRGDMTITALGVNHGLRAEAETELRQAKAYVESLGGDMRIESCDVQPGSNLQARARKARYAILLEARRQLGASFVVTAHHAEDRAETVLIRLLRGAPFGAWGVLPITDGPLLRPMIYASRDCIDRYVARHQIPVSHDPSNRNSRFMRVRVRAEVLPLLRSMNPRITEHLCALADEALLARTGAGVASSDGPLPESLPESMRKLPLRTQQALRQVMVKKQRSAEVWLPEGRVARLAADGTLKITQADHPHNRKSHQPSDE